MGFFLLLFFFFFFSLSALLSSFSRPTTTVRTASCSFRLQSCAVDFALVGSQAGVVQVVMVMAGCQTKKLPPPCRPRPQTAPQSQRRLSYSDYDHRARCMDRGNGGAKQRRRRRQ
ncbi:uncharacterized protein LY79DRAFT_131384 [Colletotrichum navitas]|uniref:Secreted protein n=1 Tax=Colletotrichum navitas TaxID=681940 RepID=A0AAD8Q2V1_9PEZI|nr:uncharacterized protein LY79DRAFT_131384 [Colletotrichum navitas]KAK1594519.1 hypothetical protein LY79DRAFT_131384 [Colletotrichum navitas]